MKFIVHYHSVFFGTRPTYIVADLDLFKEITVKHHDKFMDRLVSDILHLAPSIPTPSYLHTSVQYTYHAI